MDAVAGIDIGGTNTVCALVDRDGKILDRRVMPTSEYAEFTDYIRNIGYTVAGMSSDCGCNIIAAGVGAPGIDVRSGVISNSPNLIWKGDLPLVDALTKALGIPVYADNDANVATVGEMIFGGARGLTDFAVITLGTGVGSGFVSSGKLVYGHDGLAGEYGHTIYQRGGRECGCGRRGCLETYVSASGVVRTVSEIMSETRMESVFRDIPLSEITSRKVAEAAACGDPVAIEAMRRTGDVLGKAMADLVCVTSPEAIFFLGGLAKAGDLLMKPMRESFEESVLFLWKGKIKLCLSYLSEADAAVLGAAALAWNNI